VGPNHLRSEQSLRRIGRAELAEECYRRVRVVGRLLRLTPREETDDFTQYQIRHCSRLHTAQVGRQLTGLALVRIIYIELKRPVALEGPIKPLGGSSMILRLLRYFSVRSILAIVTQSDGNRGGDWSLHSAHGQGRTRAIGAPGSRRTCVL
jgi:hypothetical protein